MLFILFQVSSLNKEMSLTMLVRCLCALLVFLDHILDEELPLIMTLAFVC